MSGVIGEVLESQGTSLTAGSAAEEDLGGQAFDKDKLDGNVSGPPTVRMDTGDTPRGWKKPVAETPPSVTGADPLQARDPWAAQLEAEKKA